MGSLQRTALAAAFVLVACSGSERPNVGYGYALHVTGGAYDDGSGRQGLAVLATLRDDSGAGPADPWDASVSDDATGLVVHSTYAPSGKGSYAAWWWSEAAAAAGAYDLSVAQGGRSLHDGFHIASSSGLTLPEPALSADGTSIGWAPVTGARSYACRVHAGAALQQDTIQAGTTCDVSALPAGGYAASILAFSEDLTALAASHDQEPRLADRFDVAEGRLAFTVTGTSAPQAQVRAAGGDVQYGGAPGLAVWLGITQPDGSPTPEAWAVEVTGPGIDPGFPLTFNYAAQFRSALFLDYYTPPAAGTYALTATSASGSISTSFTIGDPPVLDIPYDVVASAGAQGAADVSWTAIAGARSYLAYVRDAATQAYVAGQWVAAPPAQFAAGTFTAGTTYVAYVAATDADMVAGTAPARVGVADSVYVTAAFTAR